MPTDPAIKQNTANITVNKAIHRFNIVVCSLSRDFDHVKVGPNMHLIFYTIVIYLTVLLSSCSTPSRKAETVSVYNLVGTLSVQKMILANGLKIVVLEDHSSPTIAYQTWFKVGSKDETKGQTGLAHLFEHMMFRGSKNHKAGEFDRILEFNGVEGLNAGTNHDYTSYVQELPSDKLDLIASMEAERLENLIVDTAAFTTEREVVQNERRLRNENSPWGLMLQTFFEMSFTTSSYSWPIVGYEKDLAEMRATDANAFYKRFYSPNNATIVVVGDVTLAQVKRTVEKYYAHLPSSVIDRPTVVSDPRVRLGKRKVLRINSHVKKFIYGYPVPSVLHEDIPALLVTNALLSKGTSSIFYRALEEKGLATSIHSMGLDELLDSVLFFMGDIKSGVSEQVVEKSFDQSLTKFLKQSVTDDDLEKAKNLLLSEYYEALSEPAEKAEFIGLYETIADDFKFGVDLLQRLQSVTANEVKEVAVKYFRKDRQFVLVGVPK